MHQKSEWVLSKKRFLEILDRCKSDFRWDLRPNKEILGYRDGKWFDCCTAVCYHITGRYTKLWKSRDVVKRLGFTEELRTTIIRASVNMLISREDKEMRKALMALLFYDL